VEILLQPKTQQQQKSKSNIVKTHTISTYMMSDDEESECMDGNKEPEPATTTKPEPATTISNQARQSP
jgi:hypothetical protein